MTTRTLTDADTLRTAWDRVKHRRSGPYGCLTIAEQAGALLSSLILEDAIAYAEEFASPDGHGYWSDVLNVLKAI